MLVESMCQEDLLEEEMTIHSSFPAWRMPWTEEFGRLQSMGLQRDRHELATEQQQYGQIYHDFLSNHYLQLNTTFLHVATCISRIK